MRIISGLHKGRRINPPKNLPVRPTTDMAKEGLFNILNNLIDFTEINVLDLFAGTGSVSLEFGSREALSVTSVDLNFKCVEFIRKTAGDLGMKNVIVRRAEVFNFLKRPPKQPYDLIFSDAPYDMDGVEMLPDLIYDKNWLNKNARLIIEHPREIDFTRHKYFEQLRSYGKVNFSFFKQV
ncbi:MAG: RsmD family RNA methyltransferase [Bacteroidales bacterium]|nr:RsmD family RNA methyltransferase [Bacteroidales bacterium]